MDIEQLLKELDSAQTNEEIGRIGEEILELDSNNPYGKLAIWQSMEYEESLDSLDILKEALDAIRAIVEAKNLTTTVDEDRDSDVYCTILMNLGFCLLAREDNEEALSVAREFVSFDIEGLFPSRELLYIVMLSLQQYKDLLATLEASNSESVIGEHVRAIALLETGADEADIRDAVIYAISLAPDVPFFVLNLWDFPEDEEEIDEELEGSVNYSIYLTAPWSATDDRLAAISAPTFLFGFLTERLDDEKEIQALKEGYSGVGLLPEVEAAKKRVEAMEEELKDPDEVDAFALAETAAILEMLFSE